MQRSITCGRGIQFPRPRQEDRDVRRGAAQGKGQCKQGAAARGYAYRAGRVPEQHKDKRVLLVQDHEDIVQEEAVLHTAQEGTGES